MNAEIIPFGNYDLCKCGTSVASVPVPGGYLCAECSALINTPRAQICAPDFRYPQESLADVLAKLVQS